MAARDVPVVTEAYVTLVTSNDYVVGALVLAHSLRRQHTTKHIVVLITNNVSLEKR